MSQLRASVQSAKDRLAEGREAIRRRHEAGVSGPEVCAALTQLRDEALLGLYGDALASLDPAVSESLRDRVALVALGGYGRRDVAPYSDVDLMILHDLDDMSGLVRLAERMLCDVFDVGLVLGHSVRTRAESLRLAMADATICTSLMESRFLAGNAALFDGFFSAFAALMHRRCGRILAAVEKARAAERAKYGETTHLLEPNIKRSRGGLRDLQWVRWIGMARWGSVDLDCLVDRGALSRADADALGQANAALLRVRNELHFAAGKPGDVLDRGQQVRIAAQRGYATTGGMLPVEQFMRDVFRHTGCVSRLVESLRAKASSTRASRVLTSLASRRIDGGLTAGPAWILADRHALARMRGNVAAMVRLFETAAAYDKSIAPATLEILRSEVSALPEDSPVTADARRAFLQLLGHGNPMPLLLRQMHDIGLLERVIPEFAHARGLLQFNQYHKYTVDEHCLLAVEKSVALAGDAGPPGRIYRGIARKGLLHLALLLHDLGKGFAGDHSEVGRDIARRTAQRFSLDDDASDELEFLVHRHLLMNHLAFQRDTGDEQLVVRFAVDVGSPELLQMLCAFTVADLSAVGPDTWTGWKSEVLADLYHRTMHYLAGEAVETSREESMGERRGAVRALLGPYGSVAWFVRQLDHLTAAYLEGNSPEQVAADLHMLASLSPGEVRTHGEYLADTQTLQFTVATTEDTAEGIFHRLTGALTSHRLQILSAQINTLEDRLVLDRFWAIDPDYAGEPPPERLTQIHRALRDALGSEGKPPVFRRVWSLGGGSMPTATAAQTRVRIDNATSDRYTILDVFTIDRGGLLYAITRTLFELGLSVCLAKIGTHLDQVVDVFYVTDARGGRVEDQARLHAIRQRLLDVVDGVADGQSGR